MTEVNKLSRIQMPDGTLLQLGNSFQETRIENQYVSGCINDGFRTNGVANLVRTTSTTNVNKSWTLPTYTSNSTYGTIYSSAGSNPYTIFGSGSFTPGTNWVGEVTFTWNVPETLNLTGFKYRTATVSHSSYSTHYAKFYGWDYSKGAWVLMGQKYTSGSSDYTDTYDVPLSFLPTDKFQIKVWFQGGANLPCKLHDIRPYGYKWVKVAAGDLVFNVDDGSTYKPLTATFHDGETKVFTALNSIETSGLANGSYGLWLDKDGHVEVNQTTYYVGTQQPSNFTGSAVIWKDVGNIPYKCYQYINGVKTEIDKMHIASFSLNSSAIENIVQHGYAYNNSSFPSSKYIDLTLGASGTTYTAPANGWFTLTKKSTGVQYGAIWLNDSMMGVEQRSTNSGMVARVCLPISKGQVVTVSYDLGGDTLFFRFIYAQGEI